MPMESPLPPIEGGGMGGRVASLASDQCCAVLRPVWAAQAPSAALVCSDRFDGLLCSSHSSLHRVRPAPTCAAHCQPLQGRPRLPSRHCIRVLPSHGSHAGMRVSLRLLPARPPPPPPRRCRRWLLLLSRRPTSPATRLLEPAARWPYRPASPSPSAAHRRPVVRQPALGRHTGSVILLHGLGDTAEGWAPVGPQLKLSHIKFIYRERS